MGSAKRWRPAEARIVSRSSPSPAPPRRCHIPYAPAGHIAIPSRSSRSESFAALPARALAVWPLPVATQPLTVVAYSIGVVAIAPAGSNTDA